MMRATGILFMSKTPPTAMKAADGVFSLTLLAYDRLAPQKVEPWRLIYSGDQAQEFWDFCEHEIKPGQPLHIEAERIRIVTLPAPKVPEFQGHATRIQLAPMAHEVFECIKADARAAAALYNNINDACPYSFYTEAGRVFKAEFARVRMAQAMGKTAAAKGAETGQVQQ